MIISQHLLIFFLIIFIILLFTIIYVLYQKLKIKKYLDNPNFNYIPISNHFFNYLHKKDIDSLYYSIIQSIQQIFKNSSLIIYLLNDKKDFLNLKYKSENTSINIQFQNIPIRDEKNFLVRTILENQPYFVRSIHDDKRIIEKDIPDQTNNALITYPLKVFERIEGVILILFKDETNFTDAKIKLFETTLNIYLYILYTLNENDRVDQLSTDFQKLEEQYIKKINTMQEQLILSGKLSSLGAMASGIAHEIKNPLAIIKMLVDEIIGEVQEKTYANDLAVIKTEIDRLTELVNHFLDFARPKPLHKIKCNINLLIQDTLNFLDIELKKNYINIKLSLYSTLPTIYCDHNQIKQIFINIILNAVNAIQNTHIGKGHILINTGIQQRESQKYVRITFEDNGTGIPNDIIKSLFEPFITTKDHGIGLGLAISYRIIENHGGRIEGKNRMEGGAKFVIFLPVD